MLEYNSYDFVLPSEALDRLTSLQLAPEQWRPIRQAINFALGQHLLHQHEAPAYYIFNSMSIPPFFKQFLFNQQ
jgi:hypothetical protein